MINPVPKHRFTASEVLKLMNFRRDAIISQDPHLIEEKDIQRYFPNKYATVVQFVNQLEPNILEKSRNSPLSMTLSALKATVPIHHNEC